MENWSKQLPCKQEKENHPLTRSNSSTEMDQKTLVSNPNSPTVNGLIGLKGCNATSPTTRNSMNFNTKVCNCKDSSLCDHQRVIFVTQDNNCCDNQTSNQNNFNRKDKRLLEAHNDNIISVQLVKKEYSINSNYQNGQVDCKDSHSRWKLPKLGSEDASLPDLGVSVIDSDIEPVSENRLNIRIRY